MVIQALGGASDRLLCLGNGRLAIRLLASSVQEEGTIRDLKPWSSRRYRPPNGRLSGQGAREAEVVFAATRMKARGAGATPAGRTAVTETDGKHATARNFTTVQRPKRRTAECVVKSRPGFFPRVGPILAKFASSRANIDRKSTIFGRTVPQDLPFFCHLQARHTQVEHCTLDRLRRLLGRTSRRRSRSVRSRGAQKRRFRRR